MSDEPDKGEALLRVLDHYGVQVRRTGNAMTSCPLHKDRTPSMSVNPSKGLWNCMSCSNGGDYLTLVQLKEGLDFLEALEFAQGLGASGTHGGRAEERITGSIYGGRRTTKTKTKTTSAEEGWKPSWRR